MRTSSTIDEIVTLAQLACLLEVEAPKPGNVSPGRPFRDLGTEDFAVSALAIGPALRQASDRPLGEVILEAVQATARWTATNTNLGLILLLAPLVTAACRLAAPGVPIQTTALRRALHEVLAATSADDARHVYAAIRVAAPGGLGQVEADDISQDPSGDLLSAMRLARDRDTIAREYDTGFETTFDTAVPALATARRDGLSWPDAIVETFLTVLSTMPDTHIARRGGPDMAAAVTDGARRVQQAGGVRTVEGRRALETFDVSLRDTGHLRNPGTTADVTAAGLFVVLLNDGWPARERAFA